MTSRKSLFIIGGIAAITMVIAGVLEIGISFVPGGDIIPESVGGWFELLNENPLLGLRNLGLINICLNGLAILLYISLYAAHAESRVRAYAALVTIISFIGIAVFFSTNRAFAMWYLAGQFAAAGTGGLRQEVLAAGQALLAVGESHTPGTFPAFALVETAGFCMSLIMLRSGVFHKVTAYAGMLGFGVLFAHEIISSFALATDTVTMTVAIAGGVSSMVWNILIAGTLFKLSKAET
jgi:hypothetical protein